MIIRSDFLEIRNYNMFLKEEGFCLMISYFVFKKILQMMLLSEDIVD